MEEDEMTGRQEDEMTGRREDKETRRREEWRIMRDGGKNGKRDWILCTLFILEREIQNWHG
jgi:hypothetical protein